MKHAGEDFLRGQLGNVNRAVKTFTLVEWI
jgi:hypothetical protein